MQERLSKFAYDVHMLTQMQPFAAINYIRHGIGYDEFLEKYAEERKMDGQDLIELLDELQDSARNYATYEEWFGHIEEYREDGWRGSGNNASFQGIGVSDCFYRGCQ